MPTDDKIKLFGESTESETAARAAGAILYKALAEAQLAKYPEAKRLKKLIDALDRQFRIFLDALSALDPGGVELQRELSGKLKAVNDERNRLRSLERGRADLDATIQFLEFIRSSSVELLSATIAQDSSAGNPPQTIPQ